MFEFDPVKSRQDTEKHGIDFVKVQAKWESLWISAESNQNALEPRELVVGRINNSIWAAIITRRGENIRIISARRARLNEEQVYERSIGGED